VLGNPQEAQMNAAVLKPRSRPRPRVGIQSQLAKELAARFREQLRTNDEIISAVLRERVRPEDVAQLKRNASAQLREIEQLVYREYMANQQDALSATLRSVLGRHVPAGAPASEAIGLIAENGRAFDEFFMSVAQGRKKRAGGVLESYYAALFTALGYPHDTRRSDHRAGRSFVFPHLDHLEEQPSDCVVLIAKRMLRDGWRQLAPRLGSEARTFVATLDVTVSDWDLDSFRDHEVTMVVPEHVRLSAYADQPHVISIEAFLTSVLDPAVEAWRRRHVIA
jgi:hypothetical protein